MFKLMYALSLIVLLSESLSCMEQNCVLSIITLPDDIKNYLVEQACVSLNWSAYQKNLPAIAQVITSLRCTDKSFNALLSDEKVKQLLSLNKTNMDKFLFKSIEGKAYFFVNYAIKCGADVDCHNQDNNYITPLLYATINKDYNACKVLLLNGANVNKSNAKSGLKVETRRDVSGFYFRPMDVVIDDNNIKLAQLFIANKVDIHSYRLISTGRITPLYDAVKQGNFEMLKLLVCAGANVLKESYDSTEIGSGETPLNLACRRNNNPAMLRFLEQASRRQAQEEKKKRTPQWGRPISLWDFQQGK